MPQLRNGGAKIVNKYPKRYFEMHHMAACTGIWFLLTAGGFHRVNILQLEDPSFTSLRSHLVVPVWGLL